MAAALVSFLITRSKDFPLYRQEQIVDIDYNDESAFPYLFASVLFSSTVFFLEFYLSTRQLRRYRDPHAKLPKQLQASEMIGDEKFKKSLSYGGDKLSFGMIESSFMFLESLSFVLIGGLPFMWDTSSTICQKLSICDVSNGYSALVKEVITTTIFIGLSSVHDLIIGLPFSLYSTFVIEEKHGFNKSTLGLFLYDKILSFGLTILISSPIISAVISIIRWGGPFFYFYVWIFLFIVSIFLMTVYPTLIAPLFNKYTKLESGPIYSAIEELAKKVSFPLTEIYVVDGSKRSAHSNAYFYGFFKNKRIVLFDTLIKQVELSELLAILGHEIGHWKLWHSIQGFVISQIYTFVLFLSFSYIQNSKELFQAFGFSGVSTVSSETPVFVGLLLFAQTFWQPVEKVRNKHHLGYHR